MSSAPGVQDGRPASDDHPPQGGIPVPAGAPLLDQPGLPAQPPIVGAGAGVVTPEPASPVRPSPAVGRAARALWSVLPAWATSRVVVLVVLGTARFVADHAHVASPAAVARLHQGLLGWDAGWYEAIARTGYGPLGHQSLRFF
ncbi:MAG: hypothetical protein ACRDWN_04310, partial [Acidimicrobiales bacterium]